MSAHRSVVAGGAGFLGSHLCDLLIERGDHVLCVDDCSTGTTDNVAHLVGHDRFQFVEHDVVRPGLDEIVRSAWGSEPVTRVLHLASPASPPEYLRRPIDTLDVGSIGTRQLLELARTHGARFFLASTSEVYGDPLVHPQPETYWGNVNPIGERSVYDEAKRFAEALTMAYHRSHGLDIRIARIFNTYGPRMQADDGRVVTNFVNQALRGDPLTVFGDGSQTRSFCYVDDEVRGLLAVLEGPLTGPVNVGNPAEFTMVEFAELVLELTGSSSTIEQRALPSDDPKLRQPDIAIARDRLGWEPTIQLGDGLERTIAWFRERQPAATGIG
ncbi:MAG: UDP-glucuronic acid decarboxylase family protein [Ilumatobacteraceae bacterium]|nr:UDP-glucuronic acid decarboxylase family protein [Ilumatobacteraceae bacterium]